MMRARVQTEQLAIDHMGQPGDRMIIASVTVDQRPFHPIDGESLLNCAILRHVFRIVVLNKIVVPDRPIDRDS